MSNPYEAPAAYARRIPILSDVRPRATTLDWLCRCIVVAVGFSFIVLVLTHNAGFLTPGEKRPVRLAASGVFIAAAAAAVVVSPIVAWITLIKPRIGRQHSTLEIHHE